MDYKTLKPLDLNEIKQISFPDDHYFKEETNKTQIVLHHTCSITLDSVVNTWTEKPSHTATPFVIGMDGTIYQLFSSKYHSIHLFRDHTPFDKMGIPNGEQQRYIIEKQSIGIELLNWGSLELKNNNYYAIYGNNVNLKPSEVDYFPDGYMGYKYFQKYSDAQITAVYRLVKYLSIKWNIDLTYHDDMWDMNKQALLGQNGIWTHVSYRGNQKSDLHKQQEVIDMIKALK